MKNTFLTLFSYLMYNFKTLAIFETIYRLLGIFLLFPFISFMFQFALRLNGIVYLTNKNILNFLSSYQTILVLLFLFIIIAFYLLVEFIFLSVLFDASQRKFKLSIQLLVYYSALRLKSKILKKHIFVLVPTFLFFIIVESIYFSLGTNLFKIPDVLVNQIREIPYFTPLLYFIFLLLFLSFIETVHTVSLYQQEQMTFKKAYKVSRQMLSKKRLRMVTEFIVLNLVLNGLFYLLYLLLVYVVGFSVSLITQQPYILGIILSAIYALYLILTLVSSVFLIPMNFALLRVWYVFSSKSNQTDEVETYAVKEEIKLNYPLIKKGLILTFIAIFLFNLTNFISLGNQDRSYAEYFNYPEIIAHRGSSFEAPENTLAAFNLAIEQGVDGIEFDVRETEDHIPVVIHDSTTRRTTNDITSNLVSRVTYDYLSQLDAGSFFSLDYRGEKIPTLAESLSVIKGSARVFVELKVSSTSLEELTMELLSIYDMLDEAVIMSFDYRQLNRIKDNYPMVKTMLLVPIFYGNIDPILSYRYIDYYGFSYQMILTYPEYIEKAHQLGKSIYAWTVNSESSIRKVVNSDVDGIITDKPLLAMEIASKKNLPSFLDEILGIFNRK